MGKAGPGVRTRLCWVLGLLSAASLSRGGLGVLSQAGPAAWLGWPGRQLD